MKKLLRVGAVVSLVVLGACSADGSDTASTASTSPANTADTTVAPTTTSTTAPEVTTTTTLAIDPAQNGTSTPVPPRKGEPEAFVAFPNTTLTVQRDAEGLASRGLIGYLGVRYQSVQFLARRPVYSRPLEVEIVRRTSETESSAMLDSSVEVTWDGITHAGDVSIFDTAGDVAFSAPFSLCPSNTTRIDRGGAGDGGPTLGCGTSNVLALGSRWDIADGWAAPFVMTDIIDLPVGDYTVNVEVNRRLASAIGLKKAKSTFPLVVEDAPPPSSADTVPTVDTVPFTDPTIDPTLDPTFDSSVAPGVDPTFPSGDAGGLYFPDPPPDPALDNHPAPDHKTHPVSKADLPSIDGILPDLRAMPATGISVYLASDGHEYMAYNATVWNAGPGAFVIEGFREPGSETMTATQMFRKNGREVGSLDIGTLEYHGGDHNHWHFFDFAKYEFTDASKKVITRSAKQSWCLAPTDQIDMTLPTAAIEQTFISLSSACGGPSDLWIREVLPVGWGDTYSSGFVEQHFDVTDLPNGTYYIKITANPNKNVAEVANDDANVSYRRVELGGEPGLRTVRIPPYQGIDTESFISEFGSSQFSD